MNGLAGRPPVSPSAPPTKGETGSDKDKVKNTVDEKVGQAKEKVGDATGNEDLEARGEKDQTKANLKQAGENIKDVFK